MHRNKIAYYQEFEKRHSFYPEMKLNESCAAHLHTKLQKRSKTLLKYQNSGPYVLCTICSLLKPYNSFVWVTCWKMFLQLSNSSFCIFELAVLDCNACENMAQGFSDVKPVYTKQIWMLRKWGRFLENNKASIGFKRLGKYGFIFYDFYGNFRWGYPTVLV